MEKTMEESKVVQEKEEIMFLLFFNSKLRLC